MKITLLVVGKTTTQYIARGIDEYAARIARFIPFAIQVVPDIKPSQKRTEQAQKETEGKLILSQLKPTDHLILLDERGSQYTSVAFSQMIQNQTINFPASNIVFAIGGPYGFSPEVYSRANSMLSLSKMTFPHELIRLIFVEQLYRAFTIAHNLPYHHP